ncbi:MAG: FKBP-type peptidyl-prolyl cis-trans isomerase [Chlamydiota bacterium]
MNTTKEKVSYCIGLETGRNLRQQFGDMDLNCLLEGFNHSLTNATPKIPLEEVQQILIALRNQVETQQRQYYAKVSEENKNQSEKFLLENKEKEGIVTLSSGLQYKVITSGQTDSAHPTPLDAVKIHYRGSFVDGRVFDSSYQRGEPAVLPLNRVIPGWCEILQKMHVGDKWQVFIPPYLAYGENGFGPEIGPNVTLIFEMELLGINE